MAKGKNKDGNIQATPRAATRQDSRKSAFGVLPILANRGSRTVLIRACR
jgi:hypothetical protein